MHTYLYEAHRCTQAYTHTHTHTHTHNMPTSKPHTYINTHLSEVELETRTNEVTRPVRQVHPVNPALKQLTEVLQLCLGAGDTVEPLRVQAPLINLVNALGDDDRDVALRGFQVFVEVHTKCCHLSR